jgi:hypothetical protein
MVWLNRSIEASQDKFYSAFGLQYPDSMPFFHAIGILREKCRDFSVFRPDIRDIRKYGMLINEFGFEVS